MKRITSRFKTAIWLSIGYKCRRRCAKKLVERHHVGFFLLVYQNRPSENAVAMCPSGTDTGRACLQGKEGGRLLVSNQEPSSQRFSMSSRQLGKHAPKQSPPGRGSFFTPEGGCLKCPSALVGCDCCAISQSHFVSLLATA